MTASEHHMVLRRLAWVLVLGLCLLTVLLAVPDLRPVVRAVGEMNPALVVLALALELASCVSFVGIFRMFFPGARRRTAHELAWTQMGSGALLPGGGLGSLAAGGYLLHLLGMSTREILKRSSGLFFLTSAVNVFSLAIAGVLLLLDVGRGPHDFLRAGVPVIVAVGATLGVLALPRLAHRVAGHHPRIAWLDDLGDGIVTSRRALVHPTARILGGVGYLFFDIAVLWALLAAIGTPPPIPALVVAYLVGYLANAVPIPGGVGVLDAGLVGALALYGLPLTHAAAAVLVYHAIAFWIPTIGGALAYFALRPSLAQPEAEAQRELPAPAADPQPPAAPAPAGGRVRRVPRQRTVHDLRRARARLP